MLEKNSEENTDVQIWKIKKLLSKLKKARGNGTSMISLIIPPGDQIGKINKMLSDEYSTASNIKSRVNRLSVLSAIVSTQQRLKLYQKIPENGLILYCGSVLDEFNKEKKVTYDIEPFKPINTSLYLCDSKFHTEILFSLFEREEKIGFIVIDGKGVIFGILSGNHKEIIYKLNVDLPKKHGRGGQSAIRFARLRVEKRFNFLKKVAEIATQCFIQENHKINVSGLVLAGSGEFKNELNSSEIFDPRLHSKIIQIIDVAYGGESGFNQAIELCSSKLIDLKFIREKKILESYFDEISKNSGKFVFGIEETLTALFAGAVEKIICWENYDVERLTLFETKTHKEHIKYTTTNDSKNEFFSYKSSNYPDLEIKKKETLIEWLADNKDNFGSRLFLITDKTPEGNQFVKGFGGLGGILRYPMESIKITQ
ncbi:eukaryotic release factor 1 (nucleomorph) [Chroomonas mesostigmatica CCMP1168]|uniref:Eukaryotic peptide chain release factor subunit 1 n=1 Tax=Chroomonas mesostigmatica CCMP1168 TaxID=1195612 RepID=J7G1U6_9CRYP|nr:eukaryotic release factor 1 [Chroomonas mesostigmatica CCMP1168]|mmetsp:Transcript_29321/g.72403  ORF Transcript_29321/g.72403 Transcript_29321/m.72403 type:complete len:426 (+) Transcript_29321:186-1463(+)